MCFKRGVIFGEEFMHVSLTAVLREGRSLVRSSCSWLWKTPVAGGGAGGSVWIVCSEARGVGAVTAFGASGAGNGGGGGGGGRISVQCESLRKFNVSTKAGGGECFAGGII